MFSVPQAGLIGAFSVLTVLGGVAAYSFSPTVRSWLPFSQPVEAQEGVVSEGGGSESSVFAPELFFNVPSTFNSLLTAAVLAVEGDSTFAGAFEVAGNAEFFEDVVINGELVLRQNINGNGVNIDLQSGQVIASNLVYSVVAGSGVSVSGDQDLVITNSDKGSDQKIFKKIKVGDSTLEADNNSDEVRFSAGSGISLSLSGDEITIAGSNVSGWQRSGSIVALVTASDKVGIGTSTPTNALEIAANVDGMSGLTFTNLTSSATAGIGGGKVLTVDSGGKVILVQDQTGDTPDAEDVLPSAVNGGTLYFNGLNWVSSTNLFHDGGSVGISNDNPLARLHVNTNSAATRGLIVQGYTGQSANLQEWRDENGSVASYIDHNGIFNGTANVSGTINPGITTGSVFFQGASALAGDSSNFFWDNSNKRLGIGTASPTNKLTVTGNLNVLRLAGTDGHTIDFRADGSDAIVTATGQNSFQIYSNLGWIIAQRNGNTGYGAMVLSSSQAGRVEYSGGAADSSYMGFFTKASAGNSTEKMRITGLGNVGIGDTSPASLFTVGTNDAFQVDASGNTSTTGNLAVNGNTTLGDASGDTLTINSTAVSTPNNLNFDSNTLMIDATNNRVGIGTASPGYALDVVGDINTNGKVFFGNGFGRLQTTGSSAMLYGYTNYDVVLGPNNGVAALTAKASGYIGIGTTSPTALLHAATTSTTFPTNGMGYFDWSPTSATTSTGDLFSLNIGANGTVGKLFNVKNNGSSVFSVSQTQITHNVPTQFLAAGDVSFGYDLLLTNSTASYLRSYAPMYLEAGDSTGNLDLTLRTWGVGDVIADMGGNFQLQSADPALVFNTSTATDTDFWMGVTEDANGVDDDLFQLGKGTVVGTTPYMTMTSTGNVGIGTAAPTARLEFSGDGTNSIARWHYQSTQVGSIDPFGKLTVGRDDNNPGAGLFVTNDANFWGNVKGVVIRPSSSQTVNQFEIQDSSGTGLSAFDVNGNLGIGTTAPGAKLEINIATLSNIGLLLKSTDNSTTKNLQEWQNSSGGKIGYVSFAPSTSGKLYIAGADTSTTNGIVIDGYYGISVGNVDRSNALLSGGKLLLSSGGTATSGIVLDDAGSVGAPRYISNIFETKIAGTATIGFTSAGAAVFNEQANDADFRIEGDTNANLFFVDASTDRIGIGTAVPGQELTVNGDIQLSNNTGHYYGDYLTSFSSSSNELRMYTGGGSANLNAVNSIYFNIDSDNNATNNNIIFGKDSLGIAPTELMRIQENGNVGIGTTDPGSNKLYVAGDFEVTGACTGCSSDSRLKTNVETISGSSLTKLLTLKGVTFDWSDNEKAKNHPGRQIGVIAQDVEAVFPELVGTDSRGYKFVRYDHLIAPTIEAIREQQTQLISLNGQVLQVNSTLSTLQVNSNGSLTPSPDEQLATRVAALEQQVADLTAGKTVNEQGQFEATGLIPGIARWLNNSWTFLATVVFTKSATFEDTATFDKPLAQSQDAVGSIVIPAATDSARISFADAYERAPFVTLTPVSRAVNGYVVDEVSADGFTIRLAQTLEQEVMFNWMAVMSSVAEAPAGLPGVMGVQSPGAGGNSGSGANGQIIPVSIPLASPSPSPTSLFDLSDPTTPSSSGSADLRL